MKIAAQVLLLPVLAATLSAAEPEKTAGNIANQATAGVRYAPEPPATPADTAADPVLQNPDQPVRLPDFHVMSSKARAIEQELRAMEYARRKESRYKRPRDQDGKVIQHGPALLRDPGEAARADLADFRLKVMDVEESLRIAAAASGNPSEAKELRKLAKELKFMREVNAGQPPAIR